MKRKPRLLKKLHKHWLELAIIDLSQESAWRKLLFNSDYNHEFTIDADNCEGLWKPAKDAMTKYGLEYTVRKVLSDQVTDTWLTEGGLVVFEFRAKNFPALCVQTGNNPDVI